MKVAHESRDGPKRTIIVGAGIAGLSAAVLLAGAGLAPLVLERQSSPGGKMRRLPTVAGPADAGPTVLTMRPIFEALFQAVGERLEDHVDLVRLPVIARHFWPDGSRLDLHDDEAANIHAIGDFAGARAAREFAAFSRRARGLFAAFEGPVIRAARPSLPALLATISRRPRLAWHMAPFSTLAQMLDRSFSDPRLAQIFGRYATYVGGSPYQSPALLALIWHAEASGVWAVKGGMHRLACAVACCAERHGATFRYDAEVDAIDVRNQQVCGVRLAGGESIEADSVIFNGDPGALAAGALGPACNGMAGVNQAPLSHSADVWTFGAQARGVDLAHHNVFFCADPAAEFTALSHGRRGARPTLYVCAMDRGLGAPPPVVERFEIIANAPPLGGQGDTEGVAECRDRIFRTLASFGLRFSPQPGAQALTTPAQFDRIFPHSAGSLYGPSPHGLTAAFRRPLARTAIRGLYLAGGGTHPGAGVPMAMLSGRHAAEAILTDRISTSPSRRTAMPGGTSTASATAEAALSPSSRS